MFQNRRKICNEPTIHTRSDNKLTTLMLYFRNCFPCLLRGYCVDLLLYSYAGTNFNSFHRLSRSGWQSYCTNLRKAICRMFFSSGRNVCRSLLPILKTATWICAYLVNKQRYSISLIEIYHIVILKIG